MKFIIKIMGGCMLFVLFSSADRKHSKSIHPYISNYENVLGTSLQIKVFAPTEAEATLAEKHAMDEIDRLDNIISGYKVNSEFRKWLLAPKQPVSVSPELFEVLNLFEQWRSRTNGAIDASAEVIGKLWKASAKSNKTPTDIELQEAVNLVKEPHYKLDAIKHTAQRLDDAPLMLNTFAKSYIINKACDAALSSGNISAIVLNIGGDIVIRGSHTEQVQISNPRADAENDAPISKISLQNKTIATSGNYRRGEFINGKWYSHIVDPRTGLPADDIISSTVVAPNATDAGALATAFSVLKPDESARLAATMPGVEYMIITRDGQTIISPGWTGVENMVTNLPVSQRATDKTWDSKYELLINIELAEIEGFRVHRPYVAVWVVDKNKKPVRSIALWYNKVRYLDDMHAWYNTYYQTFMDNNSSISSTSSATRSPGKYTLKWDGRDDKGKLVNQDTYTIYIEAAREHGTYQLIQQDMEFKGAAKQITLTNNTEIASASLDYRKK